MSALGDYVHYTAVGYENFGINRPGEQGKAGWPSRAAEKMNAVSREHTANAQVNNGKLIQEEMQKALYDEDNGRAWKVENMRTAMTNILQQQFADKAGKLEVKSNLSVGFQDSDMQLIYSQIEKIKRSLSQIKSQKKIDIENLTQKCKDVLSLVTSTTINKDTLQTWLSSINTQSSEIQTRLNKLITKLSGSSSQSFAHTAVSEAYQIVRTLTTWPNLGALKGEVFEYLPTLLAVDAATVTNATIEDYLRNVAPSMIKGNEYVTMDVKGVTHSTKRRSKLDILDENNEKMWVSEQKRNKTDVVITFDISELKKTPLNLSMKNYANLNKISLVNNTPLTTILLNTDSILEDDYVFANHYLNLIAKHYDTSNQNAQEKSLSSITFLTEANQIMRSIAMEIGLLGYSKSNQPDFFVINDSSLSQITVYSMQALLGLIQNNILSQPSNLRGVQVNGLPKEGSVKQTYELGDNGASKRIVTFLDSLRSSHRVNVHIRQSVLRQYMERYKLTP